MIRYSVVNHSAQTVWSCALHYSFEQLARSNPGWTYSITTHVTALENTTEPNLHLLDVTAEPDAVVNRFPVTGPRLLVLVHASQRKVIKQLLQSCHCSILCVDERIFNFREIIEASMRNKRFLSPFVRELMAQAASAEESIVLTEAESKVLDYIRDGMSGVEISLALFRSQKTVSSHKRSIMRKFGVRDDLGLKKKLLALEALSC